jgi:cytochrome c oxidase subunit 2
MAGMLAWPISLVDAVMAPSLTASVIPFNGLFVVLMVLAVGVALGVAVMVVVVAVRYRARDGAPIPRQEHGNRRLEITWTVIPVVLLAVLFAYMLASMLRGPTPGSGLPQGQAPDIIVVGHQWWWEIRYPKDGGVVNANEVHLPVGKLLLVELTSFDVQHDFWVPQLSQKMDMYPGKTNYLWLSAKEPGNYQGACAEFCGNQHAWMRILAIAQPQAEYDAWIAAQRASGQAVSDDATERGKRLFAQYACGNCHAIAGTEWNGVAAPALTNFSARQTISAGVLTNTPENLARYLRDPQAVKPGIGMPNFRLSDDEVQALVAYLESLK